MRSIIVLIIILLSLAPLNGQNTVSLPDSAGQQAANVNGDDCDENKAFHDLYFGAISKIDKYRKTGGDKDSLFWQPLAFISVYATVSYNHIMNYIGMYTDYDYAMDRHYWIEWYKKHKCEDIQIKRRENDDLDILPQEDWYTFTHADLIKSGYFIQNPFFPSVAPPPLPPDIKLEIIKPIPR